MVSILAHKAVLETAIWANSTDVEYQPPQTVQRTRSGAVVPASVQPKIVRTKALINQNPKAAQIDVFAEVVTAHGNTSDFAAGTRAIFKVQADCLEPQRGGSFVFADKTYQILAIQPNQKGGKLLSYSCLVGFE